MTESWRFRFDQWMRWVDKALIATCGMTHRDFVDQAWADWFDEGIEPEDAAEMAMEDEGVPF